jgi:hypothetical protein
MRLVLALLLAALPLHAAVTVTLQPVADAYLGSANPSTNFGNAGALVVSGSATPTRQFQSILRFDLAAALAAFDSAFGAGNWSLSGATLGLTAVTPNNASFNPNSAGNLSVQWLQTDSWTEGDITWNGLPAVQAGGAEALATASYSGGLGSVAIGLTPSTGFTAEVNAGAQLSLLLAAADPATSIVVNSRNFATVANRPVLTLSATPEPTRLMLCALGMALVVNHRRRGSSL